MSGRTLAAAMLAAMLAVATGQRDAGRSTLMARAGATPQRGATDREAAYRNNNIGVARLEQYDYDAAAASFQDALRVAPDLILARLNLAIALFYGGKPDAARLEAEAAAARLSSPSRSTCSA